MRKLFFSICAQLLWIFSFCMIFCKFWTIVMTLLLCLVRLMLLWCFHNEQSDWILVLQLLSDCGKYFIVEPVAIFACARLISWLFDHICFNWPVWSRLSAGVRPIYSLWQILFDCGMITKEYLLCVILPFGRINALNYQIVIQYQNWYANIWHEQMQCIEHAMLTLHKQRTLLLAFFKLACYCAIRIYSTC